MSKKNFSNDAISVSAPKFEKNVARTLQRNYHSAPCYFRTRGFDRLSGGADTKSAVPVNVSKPEPAENSESAKETSGISNTAMEAEAEIEAILAQSNDEESTGDKKVDEMIEYVIQNLHEAGKALASLGENFEHNLKLMFVEVMGKVQNWVSLAQIRIDVARNDLKNLRRELISRSHELEAVKKNLAECEAVKKNLAECEAVKKNLAECEAVQDNYEKVQTHQGVPKGGLASPSTLSFMPSRQPLPSTINTSDGVAPSGAQGLQAISSATALKPQLSGPASVQAQHVKSQPQLAEELITRPDLVTVDAAVQSGKGKDTTRESELEVELARLRKENEQISKERTKYENAVRRALLRGVSSLNTETLKVLRCPPPVSCFVPCAPPPTSPNDNFETLAPRVQAESKDDRPDTTVCTRSPTLTWRQGDSKNRQDEETGCCAGKRQTASAYASSSRNRKSSGCDSRSMAFILQESSVSAACAAFCNTSHNRSFCRTKSKKLEDTTTVCTKKLE